MGKQTYIYRAVALTVLLCIGICTAATSYAQKPKAAQKREKGTVEKKSLVSKADSLLFFKEDSLMKARPIAADSLINREKAKRDSLAADSILLKNSAAADSLQKKIVIHPEIKNDSIHRAVNRKVFRPDPVKATWLALVIPGGGQIYNRKYWKLPIFYGGFAGCAYALTWNNNMYQDYMNAFKDAINKKWDSKNITDLLPPGYLNRISQSQLTDILKKRKDTFRRYRDLSIFAFIGVYILSVVDAYVDAELSNFDIGPDLSMRIQPTVISNSSNNNERITDKSVGVSCSLRF